MPLMLKVHKNENFFGFDFEICTLLGHIKGSQMRKKIKKFFDLTLIFFHSA